MNLNKNLTNRNKDYRKNTQPICFLLENVKKYKLNDETYKMMLDFNFYKFSMDYCL